ncbi:MAG TPA: hypothetical protein EYG06_10285, partial [Myxococcales bacterium]|nr:hypothetical protein [Myxococcales bacterium]
MRIRTGKGLLRARILALVSFLTRWMMMMMMMMRGKTWGICTLSLLAGLTMAAAATALSTSDSLPGDGVDLRG